MPPERVIEVQRTREQYIVYDRVSMDIHAEQPFVFYFADAEAGREILAQAPDYEAVAEYIAVQEADVSEEQLEADYERIRAMIEAVDLPVELLASITSKSRIEIYVYEVTPEEARQILTDAGYEIPDTVVFIYGQYEENSHR